MPQPGPHAEEEACGPGPRRPAGHAVLTHPAFAVARPGNKEVSFPTAGGHPAGGPGEPGHTRQSLAAGELGQDSGGVQRQGLWAPERPGPGPKGVGGCWRSWKDRTRPQRALWWDARSQTRRPYTGPEPPLRLSQFAGFCFHCKRNIYPGPSSWRVWLEWKTPSSVRRRPLVWCLGSAACLPPGVTGGHARPGASHTCGKPRVLLVGTGRDLGAAELAARAP